MANSQGAALTFKRDLLNGKFAFGSSVVRASIVPDTFYGALYSTTASVTPATAAYTPAGEVSGAGYTAGGAQFTFGTPPSVDGTSGIVTPSTSLTFSGVTIGPFDAVLMYNNSSVGLGAVGVLTFGAQTVVAANFTLTMPVNAIGTALIELT